MVVWRSNAAFDKVPGQLIACPLPPDQLMQFYSMPKAAVALGLSSEQWHAELAAQCDALAEPKLTKRRRAGRPAAMRVKKGQTIQNRENTQSQFVGFCVKHLARQPSLALALRPQLAAKFFGFLLARGQFRQVAVEKTRGSIKKHCTELSETVEFVMSDEWPWDPPCTPTWASRVKEWYANVRSQATLANFANFTPVRPNLTLHMAIHLSTSEWQSFVTSFQVGWA